jgi:exocyst complex component 2
VLTRFRFIFFLTETIDENLRKSDYASILNDFSRAKALFGKSEVKLFKEVMDVLELKMENFKEALKQRLINSPSSFDDQSRLIKYLKILDPDSSPAQECITSYHLWLEKELWELQNRYCKLANEEVNDQLQFANCKFR